jgi:hypothetical protein
MIRQSNVDLMSSRSKGSVSFNLIGGSDPVTNVATFESRKSSRKALLPQTHHQENSFTPPRHTELSDK